MRIQKSIVLHKVLNSLKVMLRIVLVLIVLCGAITSQAQNNKSLADAQRYFGIKNYEQALPLYLDAIKGGVKDPTAFYQAGICYQKSQDLGEQVKAIPLFEEALKDGKTAPVSLNFDLADLYLKNEQMEKAMETLSKYKGLTKADKKAQAEADRLTQVCHNALALMSVPRDFKVRPFSDLVNSKFTEYNPVVSADESEMAFTALRPNTGKTRSGDKFIEEIFISYNQSGAWTEPKVVPIASEYNVGTAGMSADGQKMIIFMGGIDDQGSLFQITKAGDTWSKPSILANTINSKNLESTASITPDGKVIYFASNRQGTLGGLDIWKIEQKADGSWTAPVNLGPEINSKANEDAPFIHPDQKTLFFTSDGHNSLGGRDIFQSKLIGTKWTKPENMGYPVNTTANDNTSL